MIGFVSSEVEKVYRRGMSGAVKNGDKTIFWTAYLQPPDKQTRQGMFHH